MAAQGQTDTPPGPLLAALPAGCAEHHRGTIPFLPLETMLHALPAPAAGSGPVGCTVASGFAQLGALPLDPRGAPRELTDTSPRMVKCRFFSLSMTASPSGGEKVGEQLHSTERTETPRCHMALDRGWATGAGCGAGTAGAGKGEATAGGWHGELWSSLPSCGRQDQHPPTMGQGLGMEEALPEAQSIWCKRVRGAGAAGRRSPPAVQDEGTANKGHPELCLGAGQWFGLGDGRAVHNGGLAALPVPPAWRAGAEHPGVPCRCARGICHGGVSPVLL